MTQSGNILVEVWLFAPYFADGYQVPASRDNPCKIGLPYSVAKQFVDDGCAEYCEDPSENPDCGDCPKGLRGAPGTDGVKGQDGSPGQSGADGLDGSDGLTGSPGETGDQGLPGARNFCQGERGDKGVPGAFGEPGPNGLDGAAGSPGEPGVAGHRGGVGATGAPGQSGNQGQRGPAGKICPDGILDIIENDDGSKRVITRNGDCEITNDITWDCPARCWKRTYIEKVDFNATDYKVRDDEDGFGYEFPLSNGTVCNAEFNFGMPSRQPCRSVSCGYAGANPYEDDFPNINAYGIGSGLPCQDVPVELVFDKPVCGDLSISFFDVDQASPVPPDCNEIISNVNPAPSGVSGDLVQISAGQYTGSGTGNTDSDGDLLFNNLAPTNSITFSVRLTGNLSMGFGFSGVQSFKFEERGTYKGNVFYDEQGNIIPEPEGWVDVPC